jgi:uncharacterized protein
MLKKLIKSKDYKISSWKNGQGRTAQIYIEPDTENFLWRLSTATISETTSEFSIYKDYNRLLSVWQGEGLLLNLHTLDQYEIFGFSGEEKIICRTLSEKILDLGLIYDREMVKAQMQFKTGTKSLHLKEGLHFIFLAEGSFTSSNFVVETGDTLKVEGPATVIDFVKNSRTELKYYVVSIQMI